MILEKHPRLRELSERELRAHFESLTLTGLRRSATRVCGGSDPDPMVCRTARAVLANFEVRMQPHDTDRQSNRRNGKLRRQARNWTNGSLNRRLEKLLSVTSPTASELRWIGTIQGVLAERRGQRAAG